MCSHLQRLTLGTGSVGSWNSSVARDPLLRLSLHFFLPSLFAASPFSLSAPHFPFIPFAQCLVVRQSDLLRLNFINSHSGDNNPLCVRLLLWSRVSSALEGDLLPPSLPPFRRPLSLSHSLKSMLPPRIVVNLRVKNRSYNVVEVLNKSHCNTSEHSFLKRDE